MKTFWRLTFKDQSGVTLVIVALLLITLLGVGALVVDLGVLYVARNELQNAADAGAMAGARDLYLADGSAINLNANNVAFLAATANISSGTAVEVSSGEVQRGHWSFGLGDLARGFYANDSQLATNLTSFSEIELDEDRLFINAVRVVARRQATVIPSFFSRIFDHSGFQNSAEAVAYRGYAGNIEKDEVDYPLALCRVAVIKQTEDGEKVDCTTGRVLSSDQTARWTNFEQPCAGAANASDVNKLMNPCGEGNPNQIFFGGGIATTHGVQATNVDRIRDCWLAANLMQQEIPRANGKGTVSFPAQPWPIKLLVVDCQTDATPTCVNVKGVVTVNVLWVSNPSNSSYAPMRMAGIPGFSNWENTSSDYQARWADFAQHFNLRNEDDSFAILEPGAFTLYFHQDCKYHEPTGGTGGVNYGVLAKIPVLVR